jgi:hypothetical protein
MAFGNLIKRLGIYVCAFVLSSVKLEIRLELLGQMKLKNQQQFEYWFMVFYYDYFAVARCSFLDLCS